MRKKIYLSGYFDQNFGDDLMMQLVVQALPDIDFLIEEGYQTPLLQEKNVIAASREECLQYPLLIVTGSGFMINNKGALISELYFFMKRVHFGDYCLGCNMEPLDSPLKRFLIRRKLKQFKLITCRDQYSYEWIRTQTNHPQVHLLPDIVFSTPEDMLPQKSGEDLLGIVVMNFGDSNSSYYNAMAEMADLWIETTGKKVLFMAFDAGQENDLFACNAVKEIMRHADQTETIVHMNCTEILQAFSRCEKIIGARFHSLVLSLRMGIPIYPLIVREKAKNLLKDINFPFSYSMLKDIDKQALRAFVLDHQEAYQLNSDIHERAKNHVELLKTVLGGH